MPIGTAAFVKRVHQRELKEEINPDIILEKALYSNFCSTNNFYFGVIFKNSSDLLYKKHLLSYCMNWTDLEKRIARSSLYQNCWRHSTNK